MLAQPCSRWIGRGRPSRPGSAPVPQLEGEDVRCRADLEHHAVGPGAVDGAGRDQKMVMLFSGPLVHVLQRFKRGIAFLSAGQIGES